MALLNAFRSSPIGRILEALDLQVMDIGARGGIDADFLPAAWVTNAIGFEPAPDECVRLNEAPSLPWRATRYVPVALGGFDGSATLKVPESSEGASLLNHNSGMISVFGHKVLHQTLNEISVEILTLDSACEHFSLNAPDYLKIDVEGAELDILRVAPKTLEHCSAVKVEVSFVEQRSHQPLMQDVLTFMTQRGFILGEVQGIHSWRRRPLAAHPYSARWVIPYSKGIAAQCDLVFLRDPISVSTDEALVRLVCVSAILGFFDHAVTSLRQSSMLEMRLCQEIKGQFLTELGLVSRRIGRAVALSQIKSQLRTLIPLGRSWVNGIPQSSVVVSGY